MSDLTSAAAAVAWGDSPYDRKTPAEVVHDYAVVRGDLSEAYARDQLATWIERLVQENRRQAVAEAQQTAAAGTPAESPTGGQP